MKNCSEKAAYKTRLGLGYRKDQLESLDTHPRVERVADRHATFHGFGCPNGT